jgi:peptide/nickel transport system substrate-binding protein
MPEQREPFSWLRSTDPTSRREFLKRAGLLGLSIPALSGLLAACGDDDDDADDPPEVEPTTPPADSDDDSDDEEVETPDDDDDDSDAAPGGNVRHLIYEDPDTLNFIIGGTSIGRQVYQTLVEGLVGVNPDGDFYPILAAELPTHDNGGVSEDNLTVTWKLKSGVTWSDGEPFTSDDVLFTYEAATSADSLIAERFSKITSIEAPDEETVVINYSEIDVGYIESWRNTYGCGIIPRHATGEIDQITRWDWNRAPIGTGPFVLSEWVAGDHVTVVRNDNYHIAGRPHLDRIDFLIVPSEEARAQMMLQGDAEIMLWPGETYNEDFENAPNVELGTVPGVWSTRLFMNLSRTFDDDPGPEPPHTLLGDLRVRQAISMAIDRNRIVDDILDGRVTLANSPHIIGWNACDQDPYDFDPDAARQLMEDAGWVEGSGGIRQAQGAEYADDGETAEISLVTYTAFLPMELTALAIQEDLANIGIRVNVSQEDFAVIFGGWEDGAPRKTGDFDMMLYDMSMGGVEPHATIFNLWHSSRIPSAEVPGGANYTRFNSPEADELIDAAGSTLDIEERQRLYCEMVGIEREHLPIVYLYQFNEGSAYATRLNGYVVSTWEWSTWDAAEWYLDS